MRNFVLAAGLALAACSSPHATNSAAADVNAAAEQAQGDIDTYAANTLAAPKPMATATAAPAPAPTRSGTVAETPFTPDSAQGAANVVQTYFALIESGKYAQAWRLWGDGGRASGMSEAAFAASFAKYAAYHAEVGAPGDVEAGAGQRYVTVPVRVYGTLGDGRRPFELRGPVTLHRTEVDGATAEQRSWRISDSALKPRPSATAAAAAPVPAPGDCGPALRVSARNDAGSGTVWRAGAGDGRADAAGCTRVY